MTATTHLTRKDVTMDDSGMMYLVFPDGSFRGISSTPQPGTRQRVPDGATEITRDQYVALAERARVATAAYQDELRAADAVRQRADYDALRAVNLPDELARRLSGYGGE
jgi:hypothetical protein